MNIRVQKIIMYIPYFNLFLIFYWLFYYMKNPDRSRINFVRKFILGGLVAIAIHIPRILLSLVIDSSNINALLLHISIYFSSLVMCSIAIKDQTDIRESNK